MYQSVDYLLQELGTRKVRRLVDALFRHKEMHYDMCLDVLESDERRLKGLVAKSVLMIDEEGKISLDERIVFFLENFMGVKEDIQNFEIDEGIGRVKQKLRILPHVDSPQEKQYFFTDLKQDLKKLGRVIQRNIIDLSRLVRQDYKTAESPEIKRLKLEDHNSKASKLILLIDSLYEVLEDGDFLVYAEQDGELYSLSWTLRRENLRDARHNLVELSQEIVEYINRIAQHEKFFKKLMQMKKLRDLYELERRTNVEQIMSQQVALLLDTLPKYSTKPSLEFLQTDAGYDMVQRLVNKKKHQARKMKEAAEAIDAEAVNAQVAYEQRINYASLKKKFKESGQDLFQFVMDYPFKVETPFEEKVKIFCKIALMYEDEMDFTGDVLPSNGLEFAKVYSQEATRKHL